MSEKLPIGSVIAVKNKVNKFFIVGKDIEENGIKYDYMCCVYPYGWIINNKFVFFQDKDVDKLYFLGNVNLLESGVENE